MEFAPPAYPSASPGFSFASPSNSFRRSIGSSPSNHTAASYAAPSFLDTASPLLPRRSPRLNSRLLSSSFSPSPSIFNRTLSSAFSPSPTPSSKRLRADPLYDLAHSLPDDTWDNHMQPQASSPTASSQSTPIPSTVGDRDRVELEARASSDRAGDRHLRAKRERDEDGGEEDEAEEVQRLDGGVNGRYPDEQAELQRDSSTASTASKQHARLSQLQQQLLRAASGGEAPQSASKRAKRKERSDSDEDDKQVEDDRVRPERHEHWPESSSSSASSTSSFPSLSSLSTSFNTPDSKSLTSPSHVNATLSPLSPVSVSSTLSSPSRVDRSGESCHQCKTRRLPSDLIYCSARHLKKGRARKKKKERLCRKKYCARCLSKFYNELPPTVNGPDSGWICPGCRGVCSCAACKRHAIKREQRERKLAMKGGRRRRGVEKASAAKVVRAAGMDGTTAMAAPVTAVAASSAGMAVPVSAAIPADPTTAPSMAINIDIAAAPLTSSSAMAPPAPMQPYAHSRRSPRLQQRSLPPSADVVSLGPMHSAVGYQPPSSSSPSHLTSFASPSSYPPSAFSFPSASDMAMSTSPSYYASQPPASFQASPLLPPHLLLSSPSHTAMSSPYGGGGGGAGGMYGYGVSSPLMSPGSQLYRRSPRLSGRLLSENGGGGNEWNRPYGY